MSDEESRNRNFLQQVQELAAQAKEVALDRADRAQVAVNDYVVDFKQRQHERHRNRELASLRPVFQSDFADVNFSIPKIIRLVDMDAAHANSFLCKNSIGHITSQKGVVIANVYRDRLAEWGLSFYPDADGDFYYVDPVNKNLFICLNDYFDYLKIARVNELQKVAHDLGAKHFRVTYKEERKSFYSSTAKVKVRTNSAANAKADADRKIDRSTYSTVEVAAEMDCVGHEPTMPSLAYLQHETGIRTLIDMRMSGDGMLHQQYTLKLSNSSGLKVNDALRIEAALSAMKLSGDASLSSEAKSEERRYLEYEIDF